MKPELTVIIPFLNEGCEVENTLMSILENSKDDIEIIVINDGSDDEFDYQAIAGQYGARYVLNKTRLGVAASRDLGVELCETPYFLILDAHMRFYDDRWAGRIVEELKKSERVFLCCRSIVLKKRDGVIKTFKDRPTFYGAYLNFWDEKLSFEES